MMDRWDGLLDAVTNRWEALVDAAALIVIGALVGLGKLLVSDDPLSWRAIIGRTILGGTTSLVAGLALLHFKSIGMLELLGLGSVVGIAGAQVIELVARKVATKYLGDMPVADPTASAKAQSEVSHE